MRDTSADHLDDLIALPEVKKRTGFSKSEIYRRIARNEFPRGRLVGPKSRRWRLGDVVKWNRKQLSVEDVLG